jgi:hypothetical protein
MKLNVGCGHFYVPGWFNTDTVRNDEIRPDLVVTPGSDLPEQIQGVESVYMGHVLEHMPYDKIPAILGAIWERCVPGATFAAVGPDCKRGEEMHARGQLDAEFLSHLYTTPGEALWEGHPHLWDCTESLMVDAIRASGVLSCEPVPVQAKALDPFPLVSTVTWQCAVVGVVK